MLRDYYEFGYQHLRAKAQSESHEAATSFVVEGGFV